MVKEIVLTGGPCAGKTTALARIEEDLTEKGYKVFVVGESATELIKSGVRPFGDKCLDMVTFQKMIMLYQLQKEEIYNKTLSNYENDDVVIIYDRGMMDNKAYVNDREFNEVLEFMSSSLGTKITINDLLERYDMVIHLVTSADGKKDSYTLDNNNARTESADDAVKLDRKTMNAWSRHDNLVIIDNEKDFREKIDKVLDAIHKLIDRPIRTRKQLKYIVDIDEDVMTKIRNNSVVKEIVQMYLENSECEERIRMVKQDGILNYYYTKQKKKEGGYSEVILNKKISQSEYELISSVCTISDIEIKRRYIYIDNKQYYRIDEYKDGYVLEIEVTNDNENVVIPEEIRVIKNLEKRRELVKK